MGSWGSLPWDNDYALDFAASVWRQPMRSVSSLLQTPLSDAATDEAISQLIAAVDLFVRLAPYWDVDLFPADLENGIARIDEAIVARAHQEGDNSYNERLALALERYQRQDPLVVRGLPISMSESFTSDSPVAGGGSEAPSTRSR